MCDHMQKITSNRTKNEQLRRLVEALWEEPLQHRFQLISVVHSEGTVSNNQRPPERKTPAMFWEVTASTKTRGSEEGDGDI